MPVSNKEEKILISATDILWPFIEYLEQHNIPWVDIARQCHLPEEKVQPGNWVSTKAVMLFLKELKALHGIAIGQEVGRLVTTKHISPVLESRVIECENLEQAIFCLLDELPHLTNHTLIWTEKLDGKWWLCHRSGFHPSSAGYEIGEWFRTLALINFCKQVLGDDWAPEEVLLSAPNFDEDERPSLLESVNLKYHEHFAAIAIPLRDDFSAMEMHDLEYDKVQAIKSLIVTYAVLPWFSIEWLGEVLGTTARSLQRALKQEGISFRVVKENARLAIAKDLLVNSDFTVKQIAWRCGYSDLANFNRAFKVWTGITAPAYRKEQTR